MRKSVKLLAVGATLTGALIALPGTANAVGTGTLTATVVPQRSYAACGSVSIGGSSALVTVSLVSAGEQQENAATDTVNGSSSAIGVGGASVCIPGGFASPEDGAVHYELVWTVVNTVNLGAATQSGQLPVDCVTVLTNFTCTPTSASVPFVTVT